MVPRHTVKEFQVLLFNTNNSIHQSFKWFPVLYCITSLTIQLNSHFLTQLSDQTVLFLTIQFSISHLFAHSRDALSVFYSPSQL